MPFFSPFGGTSNPSGGGVSNQTFSDFGAATSDIFAGFAAGDKIKGDELEQQNYTQAAAFATQNEQFTAMSTGIKEAQQNREITQSIGRTQAQVAGAGFAESGSALDILRSSAQQGSIAKAVTSEQGQIAEAGYAEQAQSYTNMATAAGDAASAEKTAQTGDFVAGGISAVAGMFSMMPGAK
jgi:hypothetical protein